METINSLNKTQFSIHQNKLLINGKFKDSHSQQTFDSINPATEEVIASVALADEQDVDEAMEGAIGAIFLNQGQNCCAGSRTFVHKNIYKEFVNKFAEKARQRRIGNPFDTQTEQGSQIDQAQFDKIMHYIELGKTEGANCVAGGKRHGDTGYFIEPTIFSEVTDQMRIAKEEIFGPVASVLSFETIDEVIERANASPFGLAGAVWTNNIDTANTIAQRVKSGTIWVNCYNRPLRKLPLIAKIC